MSICQFINQSNRNVNKITQQNTNKINNINKYINCSTKKVNKLLPCNSNSTIGSSCNKFSSIWTKELNIDNASIHFSNGITLRTTDDCNLITIDGNGNEFIIPTINYMNDMNENRSNNSELKNNLEKNKLDLKNYFANLQSDYKNSNNVTLIQQTDFKTGTYIIDKPGLYILSEDITFNPNNNEFLNSDDSDAVLLRQQNNLTTPLSPYYTSDVLFSQYSKYDPSAYGLGFFCSIAVQTENVIIDLNGFTIKQSEEHALQQRFFSVFELADQPFIPSQGPHSFGADIISAKKCYIHNGTIGLSSHHGIHGNANKDIFLENITFKDFEVAACSLNMVDGFYCSDVHTTKNRHDIPVLGIWSTSKFIRPYINSLLQNDWKGTINNKDIKTIHNQLKTSIENTYNQILVDNKWNNNNVTPEYELFNNPSGLIDGNSYGFLVNTGGVAVLGFPDSRATASKNIYFNNVTVSNHHALINEIPAIKNPDNVGHMKDPIGSVFQTQHGMIFNSDNTYKGNVVSDAQLAVVKAINENYDFKSLSVSRNSIDNNIVQWADGKLEWNDLNVKYLCNGDSMFHVNKGVVVFKMDASENVYMNNCYCYNVSNLGKVGSTLANDNILYKNKVGKSHPNATYNGYGGSHLRGFSFSTSKNVYVSNSSCKNMKSGYGVTYGFDVHRFSENIILYNCEVVKQEAGLDSDLEVYNNNPTPIPISVGFHIEKNSKNVEFVNTNASELYSIYNTFTCLKENF